MKTVSAPYASIARAPPPSLPPPHGLLHSPLLSVTSGAEQPVHVLASTPEEEEGLQVWGGEWRASTVERFAVHWGE
jgi:hypothetical protein